MQERRKFLKLILGFLTVTTLQFTPFFSMIKRAFAKVKRVILPKGTKVETLRTKNPAELDTTNLEVTPLKDFETMGETNHKVDLNRWRLQVTGQVRRPLTLSYSEVKALPAVKRKVLLICPGVFAQYGDWKGISMANLLKKAEIDQGVTHVTISGPETAFEKVERFPIKEVLEEKVFLAYEVNGETLPEKHGFPLRVVAEDHYGSQWVKYAYKVNVGGSQ